MNNLLKILKDLTSFIKYYNDKTYLSQSWQLYAEAGIFSLEKIYNMRPTFRAEKLKTSRHLSEFWMAERDVVWMAFFNIIEIGKDEIQYCLEPVVKTAKFDIYTAIIF